jgi:hypothetical protein
MASRTGGIAAAGDPTGPLVRTLDVGFDFVVIRMCGPAGHTPWADCDVGTPSRTAKPDPIPG